MNYSIQRANYFLSSIKTQGGNVSDWHPAIRNGVWTLNKKTKLSMHAVLARNKTCILKLNLEPIYNYPTKYDHNLRGKKNSEK